MSKCHVWVSNKCLWSIEYKDASSTLRIGMPAVVASFGCRKENPCDAFDEDIP